MRFLIREADFDDREALIGLAKCFPLCSLPKTKPTVEKKIQISKESFKQNLPKEERNYLFVLEDRQEKKVIGSSQILSYFGKNQSLCYFFKKEKGKSYLKLEAVQTGRQQIGGLILHPAYRKSQELLGLQIGIVRFLYIKTFPKAFSSLIEVSLTTPIDTTKNHFWEETGWKYLKKNYPTALKIFQQNRSQFLDLFPKDLKIDLDKLSSKAKKYLTEIHTQTQPVYKGLLKRGFYKTKHLPSAGWRDLLGSLLERASLFKTGQKANYKKRASH